MPVVYFRPGNVLRRKGDFSDRDVLGDWICAELVDDTIRVFASGYAGALALQLAASAGARRAISGRQHDPHYDVGGSGRGALPFLAVASR
jgi:hypothetical protein